MRARAASPISAHTLGEHGHRAHPQHVARDRGEVVGGEALEDRDPGLAVARLQVGERERRQVDDELRVGLDLWASSAAKSPSMPVR